MRKPQVEPDYLNMPYLSRERWISFWYQLMEVMGAPGKKDIIPSGTKESYPKRVLEVGPGPGIVMGIIRGFGLFGVTVDIDFRIKPNVCADITQLPFGDKAFDCVLAAEVLEHIPFIEVSKALNELSRVSRKSIVITLPHFSRFSPSIVLKIFPFVPRVQKVFPISFFSPKHRFDGQHYWEIGKKETPISQVRRLLSAVDDFRLTRDYLIEENPFHHLFVLKRAE